MWSDSYDWPIPILVILVDGGIGLLNSTYFM